MKTSNAKEDNQQNKLLEHVSFQIILNLYNSMRGTEVCSGYMKKINKTIT